MILQLARAKKSTIAKAYGPVYAVFALVAGYIHEWWMTLLVLVALALLTVVGVVSLALVQQLRRRPAVFAASPEGTAALSVERHAAERHGGRFWWHDLGEPDWFENVLLLWRKDRGISADRVSYSVDSTLLRDRLPTSTVVPPAVEEAKKACFISASGLLTDEHATIQVMRHDYQLARFVEEHSRDYLQAVSNTTCFGVEGWVPLPANLGLQA